jgi:hypothetical protein
MFQMFWFFPALNYMHRQGWQCKAVTGMGEGAAFFCARGPKDIPDKH